MGWVVVGTAVFGAPRSWPKPWKIQHFSIPHLTPSYAGNPRKPRKNCFVPLGSSPQTWPLNLHSPVFEQVKQRSSPAKGCKFRCVCSYMTALTQVWGYKFLCVCLIVSFLRKTQEGCSGLRGENPAAFPKAGTDFPAATTFLAGKCPNRGRDSMSCCRKIGEELSSSVEICRKTFPARNFGQPQPSRVFWISPHSNWAVQIRVGLELAELLVWRRAPRTPFCRLSWTWRAPWEPCAPRGRAPLLTSAGPKRGSLKPTGKRQENATFLQRSFFNVALQFFACCSAAFGQNDIRTAEKPMLQCNFCSAAFRKLQRNFRFSLVACCRGGV